MDFGKKTLSKNVFSRFKKIYLYLGRPTLCKVTKELHGLLTYKLEGLSIEAKETLHWTKYLEDILHLKNQT